MKVTIYELLGMIKDGKTPSKIKYSDEIWNYKEGTNRYISKNDDYCLSRFDFDELNDEVEIIEEPKEHKIPGKIFLNQTDGNCYIEPYSYKQVPLKREKLSPEEVSIINKINEIIDYLEEIE